MKIYLFIAFAIFMLFPCQLEAQPKSHITHYSLEEGLSQRDIMDILQDRKGFMWLATWDGLCKFDGYNFTTYKTLPEDSIQMRSNRINKIVEDTYGYIWLYAYNKEFFRFDPRTGKCVASFKKGDKAFRASEALIMPSGKVWLISETMGAICVVDSLNNFNEFSVEKKNLPGNKVYSVLEDSNYNSWILTNNGLVKVAFPSTKNTSHTTFFEKRNNPSEETHFYSAQELDTEIWFGANNGKILLYNKENKTFTPFDTGTSSDIISIKKVYENLFVILTSNDGFLICDRNKTNIKRINKSTHKELPTNEMLSCYFDNNHNIWLETNSKGITKYNLLSNSLKSYMPNDYGNNTAFFPLFFIIEDKMGYIWAHPHGGFSFYNEKLDKLVPFFNNPLSSEWRFSDILHKAYQDKQGNIWISTRSGGLEKVVFDNTLFKLNDFYSDKISITGLAIRAILEDKNHNIWLGNLSGLISIYDSKREFKGFVSENGQISKTAKPLRVMAYTFLQDKKGNIWVGTKGDGLFLLKPRDAAARSYTVEQFTNNKSDLYSLSNNIVYSVHEDSKGRIWVGTYGGGLNLFDPESKRFINHKNDFNNYPIDIGVQIRSLQSHDGKIYIGSTFGLIVLSIDDNNSKIKDFKIYSKRHKDGKGIRANDIYDIHVTKDNEVYIATFGGGMAKVASWAKDGFPETFRTYDTRNGLHSDIVLSIAEDRNNGLWINGEGSLSRFNLENESFEFFNDASRAISNQYFMETMPVLTSDGELIYGCVHGTMSFFPEKITNDAYVPYLALTDFKVSNKEYSLETNIDDITKITLTHKENIFSIEYAALDYVNSNGILYAYKLEGFDNDWINGRTQRIVNYTNIPPGEYIFKVKSTNSSGTWVENERSLHITIKPSFWQTGWAYFIYIVAFIALLYIILRSLFLYFRMEDKILLEQEQTEMKTRFFTDISHEIRTPLTLIVSPIENILENQKTNAEIKPQLHMVLRNANRMLNLVNQILDFRKIQKQKLQVREIVIGEYIENLCNASFKITDTQTINIEVNNDIDGEKVWADPDAIEKLVLNLVSNSIKHANKDGRIEINLYKKDKAIAIQVKDEGEGMSKEVMSKLFTRFASYNKDRSKPSTGIGLSIVKEIADKHHARIVVESNVNKGSSFTILFQTGLEHFADDANVDIIETELPDTSEIELDGDQGAEGEEDKRLTVLIVEDDPDLINFIRITLKDHYDTHEASNGKEGYEYAIKYMPDFILSDIMMPEMNGIEFLRKIRANENTSHIPFILLTAKTNIDDQLEGITSGANDYITKPFSVKLLIAKIANILEQRKLYADYIGSEYLTDDKDEVKELIKQNKITEQDELFIKTLREDIHKNLDNNDFTIDDLVRNTNLSRRVFFNKVKSLTGQAPVEFIREIRIRHAAHLLKTQQYRIKEVSYMVGFSDIRYFTQCFKDMFGMTPSQYKDQEKEL